MIIISFDKYYWPVSNIPICFIVCMVLISHGISVCNNYISLFLAMKCNICGRIFAQHQSYFRHVRSHNQSMNFTCWKCGKAFKRKDAQLRHEKNCTRQQEPSGSGIIKQPRAATSTNFTITTSQTAFASANIHFDRYRQAHQALKFNMSLHVNFEKAVDPSIVTIPPAVLVTEQLEVYADTDISDLLREASKQLKNHIENYEGTGSGWVISNLVALDTTVWQLDSLRASIYHQLPAGIRNTKCVII